MPNTWRYNCYLFNFNNQNYVFMVRVLLLKFYPSTKIDKFYIIIVDRQTDRQTDGQMDRQTDRHARDKTYITDGQANADSENIMHMTLVTGKSYINMNFCNFIFFDILYYSQRIRLYHCS